MPRPGVMVTASHNPGEYNGFKICRQHAIPVGEASGLKDIEALVAEREEAPKAKTRGKITQHDVVSAGMRITPSRLVNTVRRSRSRSTAATAWLRSDSSPSLPRCPWMSSGSTSSRMVRFRITRPIRSSSRICVTFRKRCVARARTSASPSMAMAIGRSSSMRRASRLCRSCDRSDRAPFAHAPAGRRVLYDLRSSRVVAEEIERGGGGRHVSRGHSFVKAQMREEGAIFAGELSGPPLLPILEGLRRRRRDGGGIAECTFQNRRPDSLRATWYHAPCGLPTDAPQPRISRRHAASRTNATNSRARGFRVSVSLHATEDARSRLARRRTRSGARRPDLYDAALAGRRHRRRDACLHREIPGWCHPVHANHRRRRADGHPLPRSLRRRVPGTGGFPCPSLGSQRQQMNEGADKDSRIAEALSQKHLIQEKLFKLILLILVVYTPIHPLISTLEKLLLSLDQPLKQKMAQ